MNLKKAYIFAFAAFFAAAGLTSNGFARGWLAAGTVAQASGSNIDLSEELFRLISRSRMAQELLPLKIDAKLMRIAQEHAEEMAKYGFISHDISSGNIRDRMSRAGYNYETVRENLARARMVEYAHSSLLKSPGHKTNILAADVSHIGIGIAKGDSAIHDDYLYIVEVFASPLNDYEPSRIQELLTSRIEKLQPENLASTKRDSSFEIMASRSLSIIRDSYTRDDLLGFLAKSTDELRKAGNSGISRLGVSVQRLNNPDEFEIPDAIRRGLAVTYGAAVRRIIDKNNRSAFLVLTLMGIPR